MARVLTTETAKDAVQRMQGMIQGLSDQVNKLDAQGKVLSQPNNWDGPKASQFRSQVWPQAQKTLKQITRDLEELRRTVQQINADIMSAGS